MADVQAVWRKVHNKEPLNEQEVETLKVLLKGFAPASQEFQIIDEAIRNNPYDLEQPQDQGFGMPTGDWLSGILDNYQPATQEEMAAAQPGAGFQPATQEEMAESWGLPPRQTITNAPTTRPQTPDEGPDTITSSSDPRQRNRELMAEMETEEPSDIPGSDFPDTPPGGWGPVANSLYREPLMGDGLPDPQPLPGGYSFSEMTPDAISQAYNDPQLMMRILASDAGQGPASEAQMMPYLQSARALAGMGILGGSGDMNFEGIQDDPIGAYQSVEEFMDTFNQPGMQFVDQSALRGNILDRAVGQDWSNLTDQYGNPWDHDQIIETTNNAMLATAPFMTSDAAGIMSSKLNAAALEYKHLLATGEITMSYPEYLKNVLNAGEWFA